MSTPPFRPALSGNQAPAPVSPAAPGAAAVAPTPAPNATVSPQTTGPPEGRGRSGTPVTTAAAALHRKSTPQVLRRLTVFVVVAGIVFGLVGAVILSSLAYSAARAGENTDQLIRVQSIETNLLSADATATNAFLVGGLEPPDQREAYDQAIATSARLIADSATAQPADADALAALNRTLVSYAATIEQARANNRQGLPVGAQYLRNASSLLRAEALPILDNLVSANRDRAVREMGPGLTFLLILTGLIVLAGLVLTQIWVARRFRRTLNIGLLTASVVVLLALVGAFIGLTAHRTEVTEIRTGAFAQVNQVAEARIQAKNAKSNESLTLIARGSGAAFEQSWKESAVQVAAILETLPGDLLPLWETYVATHQRIRQLDDQGKFTEAVTLATDTTDPASSNATFAVFDIASNAYLTQLDTSRQLSGAVLGLVVAAVVLLLSGVATALLSRWGLAVRLAEYR